MRHDSQNGTTLTPLEELPRHGSLPWLKPGDIILVHTKKDIGRAIYRKVTKSYWNHTAMVLYPKGFSGAEKDLYIESIGGRIRIHTLNYMLNNPDRYDIGIKRIPHLSLPIERRIIAFALLSLDIKTTRHRFMGTKFVLGLLFPSLKQWLLHGSYRSSTSFVQTTLYEAVDWKDKERISLTEYLSSPLETETWLTPQEISESNHCEWIYNKRA